jgi:hypothetical protein
MIAEETELELTFIIVVATTKHNYGHERSAAGYSSNRASVPHRPGLLLPPE